MTEAAEFYPGRLWSLLDMLSFSGNSIVEAINWLNKTEALAGFDSENYLSRPENIDFIRRFLDMLEKELETLQLRFSLRHLNKVRSCLDFSPHNAVSTRIYTDRLGELRERIEQELEERRLFCVDPANSHFLSAKFLPIVEKDENAFNGAQFDYIEAGECLAFGKSTAAVFHLMRVMEYAVSQLGDAIGATIIDKHDKELEWGKIIANINNKVEALPKGRKRDEWSEAVALLYHVKNCWRNETMHPRSTHTETEAREVYAAVKTFLTRLAPLVSKSV